MSSSPKADSVALDSTGRLAREVDRAATSRAEYERQTQPAEVLDLRSGRPKANDGATALDVAHRLQQARLRRGFRTQQDAARALGIRNSTYAAHENGNRQLRLDMAEFYADRFDVSIAWLCSGHGEIERGAAEAAALTMLTPSAPGAAAEAAAPVSSRVGPTRDAAPRDGATGSLAEELAPFGAARRPDGALARAAGARQSTPLPPARTTDGFVVEVVAAASEAASVGGDTGCVVVVATPAGAEMRFVADGFVRIPTDMVDSGRLLCVKLPPNSLFPDMPGGQRVFVDPDDVSFDTDSVFVAMAEPSQKLVPVLIRRVAATGPNELALFRAHGKPPAHASEAETRARIVGRVVLVLKSFGDREVDKLSEACTG